jgi:hypothetical protein
LSLRTPLCKGNCSSSSQAWSDMSTSLFVVIVSFHLHMLIYFHCYVLFDKFYVFICRAQWPLDSNRSRFLRCCTTRSYSRSEGSRWRILTRWMERPKCRLPRRRLSWSRRPLRSRRSPRSGRGCRPRRVPSRGGGLARTYQVS